MNTLRIIRSANPKGGGVIESVIQSALAIKKLGHTVELLCLDASDSEWLKNTSVKIHAVGPAKGNYGYCPKLNDWLQQHHEEYNHFIIDGLWQYHGLAAHSVLLKNNRQYFVYIHGMLQPWFKVTYPLKHLKKWLYWPWAEYRILRDARQVFFTTDEERLLARESFWLYKCNEKIMPIGTSAEIGDKDSQVSEFKNEFPNLNNKKYLLYLGRIHPIKGIDILIKSFAAQQGLLSDMQLVIAGPDQVGWQAELEQLAISLGVADKITWTGMLSGDIKWGAYHCADAFVLPSHTESFGIVVAEALSCRLPVLISNKVNIWREIEADYAGLVADDTLAGCGQLIAQWQDLSQIEKEAMGKQARQCFLNHFEINQAVESLVRALSG
ncbi:MAG TPA: glycosyltransferase [Rhodospirillales bacterium]|nr:glycosyltransferase [Rhodospirillales bacterium]